MQIELPSQSLIVLMGPSGAGKSSFAREHFRPTEVVSSDLCRGLISDDENNQDATPDAFRLLHEIVAHRLNFGRLTVVDATNVWREDRRGYVALAREHGFHLVAVVFDVPVDVCHQRNQERPDRTLGSNVIFSQAMGLKESVPGLREEGFDQVVLLAGDTVELARVWRLPEGEPAE